MPAFTSRFVDLSNRWDPRGLRKGKNAIKAAAPDIIHTHSKHADLVGAFASRRLGIPMVSTLHIVESVSNPLARAKRWVRVTCAQVRRRPHDRRFGRAASVVSPRARRRPRTRRDVAQRRAGSPIGRRFDPRRRAERRSASPPITSSPSRWH